MGPRLFRRGNPARAPKWWIRARSASMGPRLFRRGNPGRGGVRLLLDSRFNGATSFQTWKSSSRISSSWSRRLLQWGHVFSDVESDRPSSRFRFKLLLQWGHVFSDVEMPPSRGLFQPRSESLFSSTPEKKSTPLLPNRFSGSKETSGAVREAPGIPPPPRLSQRLSPIVKEFRSPRHHAPPERRPFPPP